MTREEYLKQLIIEDSGTLKDFAKKIDMPMPCQRNVKI